MKLYQYFSYKTFYYFMKDISNLDLSKYKLVDNEKDCSFTEDDLWGYFESYHLGNDDDIVLFETDKGYFIYHRCDDIDYVKDFLIKHSKGNTTCGVFGSYRTSNVYMLGVATNGSIDRFVYSVEEGDTVEGNGLPLEKKLGISFECDKDGLLYDSLDEEDVFNYAKAFSGFDIENEDVKLLSVKIYSPCEYSDAPIEYAKESIMKNMFKYDVEELGVMITYNKANKETTISLENNANVIFCETFAGLDAESFISSIHRCIAAITTLDLTKSHKTISPINDYKYAIGNKKCNIVLWLIDTERKFMSSVVPIQKKGKRHKPGFLGVMTKGLITYDVTDYELSRLFDKCYRALK